MSVAQYGRWVNAFAAGIAAVPAAGAMATGVEAHAYRLHEDHVLGTSLDFVAVAAGPGSAALAAQAARTEIRRLDTILSGHAPDSELARLNRATKPMQVSRDLFAVIAAAEQWRQQTGSAFSGRLGDVMAAWTARSEGDISADPAGAAQRAEQAEVKLDAATGTVHRPAALTFALDGLAKGYVIDAALTAARRAAPDVTGLMLDIGGDVCCWGEAPGRAGWRVGIAGRDLADNAAPAAVLALTNAAIASSGAGVRDIVVDGEAYSHLVSPSTGAPVESVLRATVLAADAVTADALATAFVAMGPGRSLAMADSMPGIEALLTLSDGTDRASAGWAGFVAADTVPSRTTPLRLAQASTAPAGAAWPAGFAASVQYEVPKLASDNYRAPYLTIWVTDEKRELVRTLLVLGNEQRYIDSNYVWWRRYGRKDTALVDAVARPTRPPGRYAAVWDGKDDAGKAVPQGRYLVHVEATREHGGHTYASGEVVLGAGQTELALPAKDELGPLHLHYGPGT